ncbi:MAG: alanine--tRNA ligase [Fimbriimonas sp.]|nr:alanine--tRNA ligase [Fimbriimonas sp.]
MKVRDLREKFLRFFESKGHLRFPGGSLVPYDVTGRLDESLLFNGAGMIQFKPYFRGIAHPDNRRLMTAQKCIRTGDIEEVGDSSHLTFFEMLGNFSFGDYFKADAIAYSWEFITDPQWLGLDPRRCSFTIFEDDDEAYSEWAKWIAPTGIDPASRIVRLDEETNYWPAGAYTCGPPGPCGPNSEMFYWVSDEEPPSGAYSKEEWQRDEAAGKWLEFWNDVFITYEWQGHHKDPANPKQGYVKDAMPELPFLSIDTGFGLERASVVLGGYASVYDTDVFEPILAAIDHLIPSTVADRNSESVVAARRIIADHIRTSVFCIAEGILPGNNGRSYVVRRLIRRAILKGQRTLGIEKPFFHLVFDGLAESMGDFYPELHERRETIVETLKGEEGLFRRTLSSGTQLLQTELDRLARHKDKTLSGDVAFRLYDTFGFPLEVTQEIASEQEIGVDIDGYELALKDAQERSRGSQDRESVYGGVVAGDELVVENAPATTEFSGYGSTQGVGRIVRIKPLGGKRMRVALDRTPFYAESGGQTGDHGVLSGDGFRIEVTNTTKNAGLFWHDIETEIAPADLLGKDAEAQVSSGRRARILRNHTATHILQAALRHVLGNHVAQAGSYVGPDNLRFDFTHPAAMTEEQKAEVERIVNEQSLANTPVKVYVDIPIAEAKAKGAMALFGEKYGDKVRMIEVGDFSRELCGGTHVRSTGEIGLFKIVGESSAASGVRRIEAITGEAAYQWVLDETQRIKQAAELLKANPKDLVHAVGRVVDQAKEERQKREKAEMAALSGSGAKQESESIEIAGIQVWIKHFGDVDQRSAAAALDNQAAGKSDFLGLVSVTGDGKVTFIAKSGPGAVQKGVHAGNLVREVAKIAGGGGGGRPDFATAGGRAPEKTHDALAAVPNLVTAMVG